MSDKKGLKETLVEKNQYATVEYLDNLGTNKKGDKSPMAQSTAEALAKRKLVKIIKNAVIAKKATVKKED